MEKQNQNIVKENLILSNICMQCFRLTFEIKKEKKKCFFVLTFSFAHEWMKCSCFALRCSCVKRPKLESCLGMPLCPEPLFVYVDSVDGSFEIYGYLPLRGKKCHTSQSKFSTLFLIIRLCFLLIVDPLLRSVFQVFLF